MQFSRLLSLFFLALAGLWLMWGLVRVSEAQFTTSLEVTAPLGQMVTDTIYISNIGQPTQTVRLVEAWALPNVAPSAQPAAPLRVPLPARPGPLTPELRAQLERDGSAEMIVYLADQADLRAAASVADWTERGWAVTQALQAHAAQTQAAFVSALQARGVETQSFWIVNALLVRGDLALAEWLGAQADVALVTENTQHTLEISAGEAAASGNYAWGVEKIRAPLAWETWGANGQGIVVANIDSGVMYSHTALIQNYRGTTAGGVQHAYNWFGGIDRFRAVPQDLSGHGTHTMGTLAGGSVNGLQLGVAPGARWIATLACDVVTCNDALLLAGAQWVLAPTDLNLENPRPDLRPHIVNNSWGGLGGQPWYLGYVEAWNAAGIFGVFASGNNAALQDCASTNQPGNYAAAFAVGATDSEDFITPFSSRGPTEDGRTKPDISAPGLNVISAWPNGGTQLLSGTSMATPHVAGTVALMWSANSALIGQIAATRELLAASALPRFSTECGDAANTVPNNVYGWGRLDAYKAVQMARVDVPWLSAPSEILLPKNGIYTLTVTFDARQVPTLGTYNARLLVVRDSVLTPYAMTLNVITATQPVAQLSGQLRDKWTGQGVYGQVSVGMGPNVETNAAGFFSATLPISTYNVNASAVGYVPENLPLNLTGNATRTITLTLNAPHLQYAAPPLSATLPFAAQQSTAFTLNNLGPQPLSVTVSMPATEWSVSGPITSPALINMSAFPPLALADDMVFTTPFTVGFPVPIFGQLYEQIYVSSNGWISGPKPNSPSQVAACLPHQNLPAGTLAALWADLDPTHPNGGGAIRAGKVASDTFVVSYENVPPWQQTPEANPPRYTFQIILRANGRAEFRYGAMGSLPSKWAVGAGTSAERGMNVTCYLKTPSFTLANRQWTLRNQPLPNVWLAAQPTALTIPANGSQTLTATLSGLGYVPWNLGPFVGALRLNTNDPLQPFVDISAQLTAGPPSKFVWLPVVQR